MLLIPIKITGAQDINSSFGKILFTDFEKKAIIYSMGHRTLRDFMYLMKLPIRGTWSKR